MRRLGSDEEVALLLWIDYVFLLLPGVALVTWAQTRIIRAVLAGSRIAAASGHTGAEVARAVMEAGDATGVAIELAAGELSDHYISGQKVLRQSPAVHHGRSLAAVGVAAHEAAHAIQEASGHRGLLIRDLVVPWTGLGAQVCWIVLAGGFLLKMSRLVDLALILFHVALVLQLINLPVEVDASRRARGVLRSTSLVNADEDALISQVTSAWAWVHVARAVTGVVSWSSFVPEPSGSPESR
jgi:Zn-dependent membrane protease YugP